MNRFDRVISTLMLLQSKKRIRASDIADRYGTSIRTVYRDVKSLKTAGVPIIGDPGIGYEIMDGYRLPPLMFNEGETSALLTAGKFIGKLTEQDTQAYYASAMMKIKTVLRATEKQSLARLEDAITISVDNNWENKPLLQEIFRSISARWILDVNYQKADGTSSNRKIEPIGCFYQYNHWYLVAFCQTQADYRTFKINRIASLHTLDLHYDDHHISLKNYIDRQNDEWKERHQFYSIEIAFNNSFVKFAESRKYYFGFVGQILQDDSVIMKFENASLELVARWLLQFGDQATVIGPQPLIDRMKALAGELRAHYNI